MTSSRIATSAPPRDESVMPLVLAHRGRSGSDHPENTVAAVLAALADGADGVEIDVRLTADEQLVCSHDPELTRADAAPLPIATSTVADLRRAPLPGGHSLALLADLLGAAATHGRHRVVVEAKACTDVRSGQRMAARLAEVLDRFAGSSDIVVSSFDATLLRTIRSAVADIPVTTALLGDTFAPAAEVVRQAVVDGHDEVHLNVFSLLRAPATAAAARALGVGVTCWTVNRARHVQRLAALGVDALITDNPVAVRTMLRGHGSVAMAGC
jgi:glycerophosphoryl diester phosphodiesterase